jgi:hypothetical protein
MSSYPPNAYLSNNLSSDLALISNIKPGDTLSVSTRTIINHNSWTATITRWTWSENRQVTVRFIKEVIKLALLKLSDTFDYALLDKVLQAGNGIKGLMVTYSDDNTLVIKLTRILSKIERTKQIICMSKDSGWQEVSLEESVMNLWSPVSSKPISIPAPNYKAISDPGPSLYEILKNPISNGDPSFFLGSKDKSSSFEESFISNNSKRIDYLE